MTEFCSGVELLNISERKEKPLAVQDKLTRGLQEAMYRRECPPIWLVFALQIYLDIFHTLRKDASRGLEDLRVTTSRAVTSIKGYFQFTIDGNMYCSAWDLAKNDVCFLQTVHMIEDWIDTDRYGNLRTEVLMAGEPSGGR